MRTHFLARTSGTSNADVSTQGRCPRLYAAAVSRHQSLQAREQAVAARMEPGNGIRIIRALVRELGGTLDHRIGSSGAKIAIACPEHRPSAMNYSDEVSDVWSE